MRKLLLFCFPCLLLSFISRSQIIYEGGGPVDSTTIKFDPADSLIRHMAWWEDNTFILDTIVTDSSATALWQIGNTTKHFFAVDSGMIRGIMTDTSADYPINANAWFTIKVYNSIPNFVIDFWHRYQTDRAKQWSSCVCYWYPSSDDSSPTSGIGSQIL